MEPRGESVQSKTLGYKDRNSFTLCVTNTKATAIEFTNITNSYIYIMQPMDAVLIKHCTGTTFFICKSDVITVDFTGSSSITAYTSNIQITKSQDLTLYLYVSNQPVISEGSCRIQLAPYNAVAKCIIPQGANMWNRPLTQSGASSSLLDPNMFLPLVVPFGDQPDGILCDLPVSYKRAYLWREKVAEERRQLVLDFCNKAPKCADIIQQRIAEAFQKDLAETKRLDQMNQLQRAEIV